MRVPDVTALTSSDMIRGLVVVLVPGFAISSTDEKSVSSITEVSGLLWLTAA